MLIKCILLLSVISVLDAQYGYPQNARQCHIPRIPHGKARGRMRSKMIKYVCTPGYTLIGNRYATCKNGEWDAPVPLCVRPGCIVPSLKNGLTVPSVDEAWVVFFCMPGFRLVGSPAIFCDGRQWNATAPTCVDSTSTSNLSCNFESPDLCGWTQDAFHDFDWERLNKKTPSSFLSTGPSYDHTYGKGGSGYYMYIESSSRMENDTARLISPIYEAALTNDGCFAFYYHMFGRATGGLRVYQRPDDIGMEQMLHLPEAERQKYQLFEQWGNQGDIWFGEVAPLKNSSRNFQIVIEGIRGKRFTSDIAIDDVAILQGENCTAAKNEVTTPAVFLPDSCEGRCTNSSEPQIGCSCHLMCLVEENCCPDYFELCVYSSDTGDDSDISNTTVALPQTQKLIKTTTPFTTTKLTTTSTTTTVAPTTIKLTTTKPTTLPKPKTTPKPVQTTPKPLTTTPKPVKTTSKAPTTTVKTTTQQKVTVFQKDAIKDNTTNKPVTTTIKVVNKTTVFSNTTKAIIKIVNKTTTVAVEPVVTKVVVKKATTAAPVTQALKKTSLLNDKKRIKADQPPENKKGSAWKTVLLTVIVLICCAGATWLAVGARGARGRMALDYLRGRTRHDPEVRYLHSSSNDDDF